MVGHRQGGDPVGGQVGGGQRHGVDVPAAQPRGGHDLFGGEAVAGGDAEAVPGVLAGGEEGGGAVVEGLDLVGHQCCPSGSGSGRWVAGAAGWGCGAGAVGCVGWGRLVAVRADDGAELGAVAVPVARQHGRGPLDGGEVGGGAAVGGLAALGTHEVRDVEREMTELRPCLVDRGGGLRGRPTGVVETVGDGGQHGGDGSAVVVAEVHRVGVADGPQQVVGELVEPAEQGVQRRRAPGRGR